MYSSLHGTPLAPALLIADGYFLVDGGTEVGLAAWKIYLAIDAACDQRDIDHAADVFAGQMAGPVADKLIDLIARGVGKGFGKLKNKPQDEF